MTIYRADARDGDTDDRAGAALEPTGEAVEVVAHRGAGAAFTQPQGPPENTARAVEAGFLAGADGCEIDVQLTRDGHVAVIHDATIGRTCRSRARDLRPGAAPAPGGSSPTWADRAVADLTLAELRALDAGRWKGAAWAGEPVPSLADILALVPAGRTLWIELKPGAAPEAIARAVADSVRAADHLADVRHPDSTAATTSSRVRAISFDIGICAAIKRALPAAPCYLLVDFRWDPSALCWIAGYCATDDDGVFRERRVCVHRAADLASLAADARAVGADGLDVSAQHPEPLATVCADAGLTWAAWTVNDPALALALAHRGARAITTDLPVLIAETLRRADLRAASAVLRDG